MPSIFEPPRPYLVFRETGDGSRKRVGMYPTEGEAREAIARSNDRHPPSRHTIWRAEWQQVGAAIEAPTEGYEEDFDESEAEAEAHQIEGGQH